MSWNVTGRVYSNPEGRKTLLETPSGFALFDVSKDALKKADDIWLYFKDVDTAKNALFALGFVKFVDKSIAWDGGTRPSNDLIRLIRRFCNDKECLFVQNAELKDIVTKKLVNVKCSYDHNVDDEVIWGIKNVLHWFIPEEIYNRTREYRLPPSKGLQQCLQDFLINITENMLNTNFISDVGLLRYLDITLEKVPKILREKFDEHVCKIGERIENDLKYAKVVAKILVPELSPTFDFNKMFPYDLALKVQEADKCATKYRNEKLSMGDRELIMGSLSHLLVVPKQRDDLMIRVKLMEAQLRNTDVKILEDEYKFNLFVRKHYLNLKHLTFRRILLETPSGFAIFGVNERVFERPKLIWVKLSNADEANEVVLALGFVKIDDKSIARNRSDGPGPELSRIIQKLCTHENTLIVQDDALKSIIEEKLEVKCCTKCSNDDDDSLGDLMWGLKYFLHCFIPQEADNVTDNYYKPVSKGLLKALRSYDIVPQGQLIVRMEDKFSLSVVSKEPFISARLLSPKLKRSGDDLSSLKQKSIEKARKLALEAEEILSKAIEKHKNALERMDKARQVAIESNKKVKKTVVDVANSISAEALDQVKEKSCLDEANAEALDQVKEKSCLDEANAEVEVALISVEVSVTQDEMYSAQKKSVDATYSLSAMETADREDWLMHGDGTDGYEDMEKYDIKAKYSSFVSYCKDRTPDYPIMAWQLSERQLARFQKLYVIARHLTRDEAMTKIEELLAKSVDRMRTHGTFWFEIPKRDLDNLDYCHSVETPLLRRNKKVKRSFNDGR